LDADPRISSKTRFFVAAAIVTHTLASGFPSDFMQNLSKVLEDKNIARAGAMG
jgi:hypothetical protein